MRPTTKGTYEEYVFDEFVVDEGREEDVLARLPGCAKRVKYDANLKLALVQVTDSASQAELRRVLMAAMSDHTTGFDLDGKGIWHRRASSPEQPLEHLQEALLRRAAGRAD